MSYTKTKFSKKKKKKGVTKHREETKFRLNVIFLLCMLERGTFRFFFFSFSFFAVLLPKKRFFFFPAL